MYSKTITILAAVLAISACSFSGSSIRRSTPDRQGMNGAYLSLIDSAVNASIADGEIPPRAGEMARIRVRDAHAQILLGEPLSPSR